MGTFDILFLGTCAHDYSPKLLTEYKDKFDYNARRSSAILLNKKILVDCGDHILDELRIANVNVADITDVILTHLHGDHYNVSNLERLSKGRKDPLRLWVRQGGEFPNISNVEVRRMDLMNSYDLGDGLTVIGMPANHDAETFPQHLLFKKEGKSIFYGCDGAWFLNETYKALKNAKLDFLVLDCTCGDYVGEWRIGEHNTIPMIRLMLPSLRSWGTITEETKVYISHLAPSLHLSHAETVKILKNDSVEVAYDGLEVMI